MSWFYDTFLPSLLERAGTNNPMWLSRRQTEICIDKMEKHTTMAQQFQGDYYRHNYYTMEWNGRSVCLNYSKLNGCGQITFGFTPAEAEESSRRRAEEKRLEKLEDMERKRRWAAWARENEPEALEKRVNRWKSKVEKLQNTVKLYMEDLQEEEAEGGEFIKEERAALDRVKKELAEAEEMLSIYL